MPGEGGLSLSSGHDLDRSRCSGERPSRDRSIPPPRPLPKTPPASPRDPHWVESVELQSEKTAMKRSIPTSITQLLLTGTLSVAAAATTLGGLGGLGGFCGKALAHGVRVESEPAQAFRMRALYDSGDPMGNAQVTIYAPDDPTTPWQQFTTDDQGYFMFAPDPTVTGNWDVQVRKAGHGELVRVDVDGEGSRATLAYAGNSSGQNFRSPVQKWVTVAAVVWGFVGTALFFAQRHSGASSAQSEPKASENSASSPANSVNH